MFVPIILGSDKTTVSIATGQNEYYPLYLSIGNVQNHIRRAHKNALVIIGFLPIPKGRSSTTFPYTLCLCLLGARKDTDTEEFRLFKRTLTHGSIAHILLAVKPFMKTPDIVQCSDQYFRRAIYGLGPHISDYPEQAMIVWILLNWCPTYVISFGAHSVYSLKCSTGVMHTRTHSTLPAASGQQTTRKYC